MRTACLETRSMPGKHDDTCRINGSTIQLPSLTNSETIIVLNHKSLNLNILFLPKLTPFKPKTSLRREGYMNEIQKVYNSLKLNKWHILCSGRASDLESKGPTFNTRSRNICSVLQQSTSHTLLIVQSSQNP